MAISENVKNRRDYLEQWLKQELKILPVSIHVESNMLLIKADDKLICGIQVNEEYYKFFNVSEEWKEEETSYHCEQDNDGSWYYYMESADECISECKSFVIYEAKKNSRKPNETGYSSAPIESDFWQNRLREILGSEINEKMSGRKSEGRKQLLRFECFGPGSAKRLRVYLHNEGDEHEGDPEIISIRVGHNVLADDIVQSIKPSGVYFKNYTDECKVRFDIESFRRKENIEEALGFIKNVMNMAKRK